MPHSGCSVLHGVNPNKKIKWCCIQTFFGHTVSLKLVNGWFNDIHTLPSFGSKIPKYSIFDAFREECLCAMKRFLFLSICRLFHLVFFISGTCIVLLLHNSKTYLDAALLKFFLLYFGWLSRDSLTHPILITAFIQVCIQRSPWDS